MTTDAPAWTSNASGDDWTAHWRGCILRAEDLGQGWWWAAYGPGTWPERWEVSCWTHGDGSAVLGTKRTRGKRARAAAERAAGECLAKAEAAE